MRLLTGFRTSQSICPSLVIMDGALMRHVSRIVIGCLFALLQDDAVTAHLQHR